MAFSTQSECATTPPLNPRSAYPNYASKSSTENSIPSNLVDVSVYPQRNSSHAESNVFRITRFKIKSKLDDIKRFLRTSSWHLSLPLKRPYPAPELSSLKELQRLHKQYFAHNSPFFEIDTDKKSPKKTAEMVLETFESYQEPNPPRFIEPFVKVIYEKLRNTYNQITEASWHNTEPKNGCIGLLFAYILTALNNSTDLEKLNSFLQAAVYNKKIFQGTSQVVLKNSKAINAAISLIASMKIKIEQDEDKNEAIERTLHKLRNVLQLYLSETIDMIVVLLSDSKILTKGFNIVDCNSVVSPNFKKFSPSLQDFLATAHTALLYTNENRTNPRNDPIHVLDTRQHSNIHVVLKKERSATSLVTATETFLSHLTQALALYQQIYWANKGDKNFSESLPAIETNIKRNSYTNEINQISQHTRSVIETLNTLIPQLKEYNDLIYNYTQTIRQEILNENNELTKPKHQNWIKNNLPSFSNKRLQSNGYLTKSSQCIEEYMKACSSEGQEKNEKKRKEILRNLTLPSVSHQNQSNESASDIVLRSSPLPYRATA